MGPCPGHPRLLVQVQKGIVHHITTTVGVLPHCKNIATTQHQKSVQVDCSCCVSGSWPEQIFSSEHLVTHQARPCRSGGSGRVNCRWLGWNPTVAPAGEYPTLMFNGYPGLGQGMDSMTRDNCGSHHAGRSFYCGKSPPFLVKSQMQDATNSTAYEVVFWGPACGSSKFLKQINGCGWSTENEVKGPCSRRLGVARKGQKKCQQAIFPIWSSGVPGSMAVRIKSAIFLFLTIPRRQITKVTIRHCPTSVQN